MEYGTEALQQHNQAHARAGAAVVLGYFCRVGLPAIAERATLTRKQSDGLWFADVDGDEWCIGSGYDWRLE